MNSASSSGCTEQSKPVGWSLTSGVFLGNAEGAVVRKAGLGASHPWMLLWAPLFSCQHRGCPRFCILLGRCGQSPLDTTSVFALGPLQLSELPFCSISAPICFLSILFWGWRGAGWCHHISSDHLDAEPFLHQPSPTPPSFLLHPQSPGLPLAVLVLFFTSSSPSQSDHLQSPSWEVSKRSCTHTQNTVPEEKRGEEDNPNIRSDPLASSLASPDLVCWVHQQFSPISSSYQSFSAYSQVSSCVSCARSICKLIRPNYIKTRQS